MTKNTRGLLYALFATIGFSTMAAFGRALLQNVSPLMLIGLTQFFSAFTVVVVWGLMGEIRLLQHLHRHQVIALLTVSLLSGIIGPAIFYTGLQHSTATNAILLIRVENILTVVFSVWLLKEHLRRQQIGGILVMLFGIVAIVTRGGQSSLGIGSGDLLLLLSSVCYASANLIFKRYLKDVSPELVVLCRNTMGALVLIPQLGSVVTVLPQLGSQLSPALLMLAIVPVFSAQLLWYKALEYSDASKVSLINLSAPLFGTLFAVAYLGETLEPYHLLGAVLIIGGMLLLLPHQSKHKHFLQHLRIRHLHA